MNLDNKNLMTLVECENCPSHSLSTRVFLLTNSIISQFAVTVVVIAEVIEYLTKSNGIHNSYPSEIVLPYGIKKAVCPNNLTP
jgi:hypothetical protein